MPIDLRAKLMSETDEEAAEVALQAIVEDIPREREQFLERIAWLEPSAEERHRLRWVRLCQEEDAERLQQRLYATSRELEAVRMEMKDRESTIVAIKREQADDRVRIQRLLSLSQPAIHDFSFVYEGEEPPTAELAEVRGIDWRNLQTLVHVPSSLPPLSQCTRGYAEYLARKARIIEVCGTGFEELGVECRARVAEAEADRESQVLHAERLQSDLVGGLHQRLSEVASVTKVATDEYLCLRHNSRVAHASSMKLKLRRSQAQREREGETKMTERRTQTERLALGSEAARRLEEGLADARKSMLISARGLDLTKEHYSRLKAENQAQLENLQRQIATERRAYYDLCSRRKQHLPQLVQSLKAISASVKHEQFEAQLAALLGGK